MRKKIKPTQSETIGARLKAARLRSLLSISELSNATGVHHSQISRCERGNFKTYSKNVQKLCNFLDISFPGVTDHPRDHTALTGRFEAILKSLPSSVPAFAQLFDLLEGSAAASHSKRRLSPLERR